MTTATRSAAQALARTKTFLPTSYYDQFVSEAAKARKPSPIRKLFPLENRPGMISMLAGKPNPGTFPFTNISFTSKDPYDRSKTTTLSLDGDLLDESLQYGATSGLPRFVDWLTGLQEREHGRNSAEGGWGVSVGTGSQDLINKALITIINPGDALLMESPVYATAITLVESLHAEMVGVPTDGDGIRTDSLRSTLENWPKGKPKPKALYTIPYGGNPAGTTTALERRKEVLKLAREHDFLIIEDDPYYYLYFGETERPASYFALENQEPVEEPLGRVLRFDSLSKVLSAGMRVGFVTGPAPLVQNIDQNTQSANLQSSHLSQAVAFTLLDSWGYEGFKAHTDFVSEFYREKRDQFENALRTHLSGLAEWNTPCAGMFVWFKLLLNDPDSASSKANDTVEEDSEQVIRTRAVENGVLALPGTVFLPNGGLTPYVRASFSLLEEEAVNEAMKRLRVVVLEARGQKPSQ
jgi:tryptophan aminotransferase